MVIIIDKYVIFLFFFPVCVMEQQCEFSIIIKKVFFLQFTQFFLKTNETNQL
jgi:hypothetical protein